ncbi:larval cuticle protein 65Ab1-like [Teleopsis dalmanni]|uniref:larval cuticle protein 65Ab1-like n=1 Tax=Teleopsis dalmanni TaxID=139649 RepID=UPI0018CF8CB1|nr:larval cuticle protein 65Ab1-like [Teleopsis dalmanni]
MKFIIVLAALFTVALARPGDVEIVKLESDVQPESYKYAYETSDGTSHSEDGTLKDAGTDHEAIVVHGTFSWVDKDGQKYTVNYVADENGFQPEGDHLPKA